MANVFGVPEIVTIAGFPFSKLGSLKRKEEAYFQNEELKQLDGLTEILEIANQIAEKHNLPEDEAYTLVATFGQASGSRAGFLVEYADRMESIKSLLALQQALPAQAATLMIQSRVSSKWLADHSADLQEAFEIELGADNLWKPEYTDQLPVTTIEKIAEFVTSERNQWKAAPAADSGAVTDSLGNDSKKLESNAIAPTPTGTKFTGESSAAPLMTPGLTPTVSMTNPST